MISQPTRNWLRFSDFAKLPKWDFVPLHKLARRVTDRNTDGIHTRVLTNSAEFGVVDQKDYFDRDIVTQANLDTYFVVERGDFVYNPRVSTIAPVGPISKNRLGTGIMSPLYTIFRFLDNENDFYAYYFKSSHWHEYLRRVSNSGARHDRMSISNEDFLNMPVPAPTTEERDKIARFIASLDGLISVEADRIELLKRNRKGFMQKLFPSSREIE